MTILVRKRITKTADAKTFSTDEPNNEVASKIRERQEVPADTEQRPEIEQYVTPSKFTTFFRLLKFSSCCDIVCIIAGLLCSLIQGASLPLLGLLFGKMTDDFLQTSVLEEANNKTQHSFLEVSKCNASNITDKVCVTPEQWIYQMRIYSLYYLIICFAIYISAFFQAIFWEMSCEKQIFKLRKLFFSKILRQEISWYEFKKEGDLSNKLWDDFERVREGIGYKCSKVSQHLSTFIIGLAIGFWANWKLTLALLAFFPSLCYLSCKYTKQAAESTKREQMKYGEAAIIADQVLHCLRTVSAFGGETKEAQRYEVALEEGRKLVMNKYIYSALLILALAILKFLSNGVAFYYGGHLIADGEFKAGTVFVVIYSVLNSAFEVANVLPFWNYLTTAIVSAENIFKIIDRRPKIDSCSEHGLRPDLLNGRIEFKDVGFSYPCRSNVQVLKNLSLTIEAGETVAVIGPSGSGKSTIVKLLLRFYDTSSGQIYVDGNNIKDLNLKYWREQIGVVSQEPVLFGGTIADNVRYGREDATIEDIEEACRLANAHSFISNLPNQYSTEVGPRGHQLSGGEKQRIAIARALVRNPRILLLDEATSALDSQNEALVQEALDQAMIGRTTIIIAHRLSTIRNVNRIFALKDGEIVETGNHAELMRNTGLYYELVKAQERRIKEKPLSPDKYKNKKSSKDEHTASTSSSSVGAGAPSSTSTQTTTVPKQNKSHYLYRLIKLNSGEWFYLTLGILCAAIGGTSVPVKSFFYGQLYANFQMTGNQYISSIDFWSFMLMGFGLISGTAHCVQTISISYTTEKLITRLRWKCFMNILRQETSWFDQDNYTVGKLLTRLSRDGSTVKSAGGMRVSTTVQSTVTFLSGYIIALIYGWQLALVLLCIVPFLMLASYGALKQMRYSQVRDNQSMDNAGKVVSECVQNITTVQSLGKEHVFVEKYNKMLEIPLREMTKVTFKFACVQGLSETVVCIMYFVSFLFGSFFIDKRYLGPSDVYRVLFAVSLCAQNVGQTIGYLKDWKSARESARNMLDLLDKQSKLDPMSDDGLKPEIRGKVTFNNVVFSYPSRKDVTVLDGLSFTVDEGETLALVGGSGCGKSTIISLLERFYVPDSGQILIDDYDICELNTGHVRAALGLVTQEPDLFNCSIRDNIAYGSLHADISDQDIIEAAKAANIHEFIISLQQGYDTICGDHGAQVSGGEKQRIAIARAIVRQPKILLLDEATSALDTASEKLVQEALDKARSGRTSIIIAHRLSTIQNADKIVVINNGRVVEVGTHEELISIEGGYYFKLTKRQQI